MPEISLRAKKYEASPVRKITSMLEKIGVIEGLISFGGGAPSLAPAKEVVEYVIEKLKAEPQKSTAYCSSEGYSRIRELIAQDLKRNEKIDIDTDEIDITMGGTEALFLTIHGLLGPGDEIILADPTYLGYPEPIKWAEAKAVRVKTKWEQDFQLLPEKVEAAVTNKTKAVLILSPDNPTGRILEEKNLKAIVEITEDKDLWLITDDIYKEIIYEGKFFNSRRFGGFERTITCCSFSKCASLPGVRIGYVYGPKEVVKKLMELNQATSLAASTISQLFIEKFLANNAKIKHEYLSKTVIPTYKKRRNVMGECLKKYLPEAGFSIPKGAFYFFPDLSYYLKKLRMDDEKFCDLLLKEKKVVAIPGKYFGEQGKNHVRLTFVSEKEEKIEEGIKRIADFVGKC